MDVLRRAGVEEQGGLRATFACGCMLRVLARPMADRQSRQTCARMDVLVREVAWGEGAVRKGLGGIPRFRQCSTGA